MQLRNKNCKQNILIIFYMFVSGLPLLIYIYIYIYNRDVSKRSLMAENHYNDAIMGSTASQITSLTIVYSTVYSGVDQRKQQSPASLAFVRGIHRSPVNSPHKGPVTRKMFPFDDVIMYDRQSGPVTRWYLIAHQSGRCIRVSIQSSVWSPLSYFLHHTETMRCRHCDEISL